MTGAEEILEVGTDDILGAEGGFFSAVEVIAGVALLTGILAAEFLQSVVVLLVTVAFGAAIEVFFTGVLFTVAFTAVLFAVVLGVGTDLTGC